MRQHQSAAYRAYLSHCLIKTGLDDTGFFLPAFRGSGGISQQTAIDTQSGEGDQLRRTVVEVSSEIAKIAFVQGSCRSGCALNSRLQSVILAEELCEFRNARLKLPTLVIDCPASSENDS